VRSAATTWRLRRLGARILFGCAAVASSLLGTSPRAEHRDPTGSAFATSSWAELARATFDAVADGPGDGKSFPAEVGNLTTLAPPGMTLTDVSPASGISNHRLHLIDVAAPAASDFGVALEPAGAAGSPVLVSFLLSKRSDAGTFAIGVDDGATTELCLPGSVNDGATTELVSIRIDGESLVVNGLPYHMRIVKGSNYEFVLGVFDLGDGLAAFELAVLNVDTGEVEDHAAQTAGAFHRVSRIRFVKQASKPGEFTLDNLSILAQSH